MCERVFVHQASSNHKGSVAELAIAKAAALRGIGVLMPMTEHGRYDLAFEIGDEILRVQCKSATRRGETVVVRLVSSRRCAEGFKKTRYWRSDVDLIAAYCDELDVCYLIPIELVEGTTAFQMRLSPARNNQLAAINFAADYEFSGAVAQLEERVHGMHEVRGSSPLSSTFDELPIGAVNVGAEEFGAHTARFLERAAAGEEFLITRRGKPKARLLPVSESAPLPLFDAAA
jgi:prevent-host-death family protein